MKNQSRVGWAETSGFRLKGRMFFTEREIDRSAAGLFAVSAPRGKPQETKQSIVAYERIVHKESASAQIPDDLPREERIIDHSSCFFPAATPGFGDAAQLSSPTQKTHVAPLRMAVEHVDFGEAGLVPPEAMSRTPPCSTSAVPARRLRSASARTPPRNATSAAPLTS